MAFHHSPKIVTNGLVLSLDAADKNSYPGSGTTVYDLSGNNLTGTMTNVTWNSAGYFVYGGTSNVISLIGVDDFESAGAVEIWLYPTAEGGIFSRSTGGSWANERYVIHMYSNTTNHPKLTLSNGSSYETEECPTALTLNSWSCLTVTHSGSTILWYINGAYQGSDTTSITPEMTGVTTRLGQVQGLSPNDFTGNISICKIYNRVLSQIEISQNFNAQRSRFGV